MVLHEYLEKYGLKPEEKQEHRLGEIISNKFFEEFGVRPSKIHYPKLDFTLNNYEESFLLGNADLIRTFIRPKRKRIIKSSLQVSFKPSNK